MKYGEFDHPLLEWSMLDSDSLSALENRGGLTQEQWHEAFNEQELKLSTPVRTGVYDFCVDRCAKVYHGIVVKDGKFEPYMTAHAIYIAQVDRFQQSMFDHVFIESIKWDMDANRYYVIMGS